jgi:hypothetical protein
MKTSSKSPLFFPAGIALALPLSVIGRLFYAAPGDSTNSDGSLIHPYPRIQQAADRMVAGDTCYIRQGTYRETVTPPNSGTSGKPIVFASYPGEKPVVNGCDVVAGSWSARSGSIYTIAYSGAVKDIFVDGQCMLQARHPNMPYDSARGGFTMLMPQDNAVNPPAGVDWTGVIRIHDAGQTWANKVEQSNAYANDGSTILIGPVGLLDSEGEWAFKNSMLYLWAPRGRDPGPRLVEAKSRDYGFNLQQRSYTTVKGITFIATSLFLDQANNCVLDSCTVLYPCHLFLNTSGNGFNREGGPAVSSGGKGVTVGGSANLVRRCVIAHSWGDGLTLYGAGNTVENCHIYDCDWSGTDCAALCTGGSDHIVRNNTIHDAGRSVLLHRATFGARFEYNDIFGSGWLKSDLGITYTLGSGNGTEIRYNWIHEAYSYGLSAGVYLDNGSRDFSVHHNVIFCVQTGWNQAGFGYNTPQTNISFINNTIDNMRSALFIGASGWSNCRMINNIFQRASTDSSPTRVTVTNNYEDSTVAPGFVDADAGDFRLLPTSPCINKGAVVSPFTDGYSGGAPDQGAYEQGATDWTAGASIVYRIWAPPNVPGSISRHGWRYYASPNNSWAILAGDGRTDTRWDTYTAFPSGTARYFIIDMQKPRRCNGVLLYSTVRPDQTVPDYQLFTSLNGIYGTPAVTGTGQGGRFVLYFPVQQTQYIKIQTSAASTIWAIEEIFAVYDTARLQAYPVASRLLDRTPALVRVFSPDGRFVARVENSAGAKALSLRPGLYVERAEFGNGRAAMRMMIIKR